MEPLRIKLHLKEHCIETAAKRELKHLTDLYFNTKDDMDVLLKKIELLQGFISESDFPKLRSGDERLSGMKESFVIISMGNDGKTVMDFENI